MQNQEPLLFRVIYADYLSLLPALRPVAAIRQLNIRGISSTMYTKWMT
jgi:hypothetical protein